jgi:hypothetical protein
VSCPLRHRCPLQRPEAAWACDEHSRLNARDCSPRRQTARTADRLGRVLRTHPRASAVSHPPRPPSHRLQQELNFDGPRERHKAGDSIWRASKERAHSQHVFDQLFSDTMLKRFQYRPIPADNFRAPACLCVSRVFPFFRADWPRGDQQNRPRGSLVSSPRVNPLFGEIRNRLREQPRQARAHP